MLLGAEGCLNELHLSLPLFTRTHTSTELDQGTKGFANSGLKTSLFSPFFLNKENRANKIDTLSEEY